ncbi:hypothetical protein ACFO0N_12015 [Halobium salinum]|uniref:Uncharacterized protein n=1 Tax=Halobium salinum TaxID=1364940 RepID=A0ABD5PD32_9EURY|nr:hypothetical protein [Halobium salinum]
MDARTPQGPGPNRAKRSTVRLGHGTAARLAFEDATQFYRSANRELGDEMVRDGLVHLAVAFEGAPADERGPSAMSFGGADGSAADD